MRVVKAFPPHYRAINLAFGVRGKNVIFCFGDTIYNPSGVAVGRDLIAHESVHSERQKADPYGVDSWWARYVVDPKFRLAEEIPAHQAEFRYWQQHQSADRPVPGFRSSLDFHRVHIAKRLASPLYGGLVTMSRAMELVAAA